MTRACIPVFPEVPRFSPTNPEIATKFLLQNGGLTRGFGRCYTDPEVENVPLCDTVGARGEGIGSAGVV
jgi:hypothetical protein